jgi:hypothetical protein
MKTTHQKQMEQYTGSGAENREGRQGPLGESPFGQQQVRARRACDLRRGWRTKVRIRVARWETLGEPWIYYPFCPGQGHFTIELAQVKICGRVYDGMVYRNKTHIM